MASERVVMVGAGGISGAWFPPLKAEGVEIVGIVDLDEEKARQRVVEQQLDAAVGADLKAMLARTRPDFVLDLTVPAAHAEVTCTALEAGCHVLGEKPMAAGMDEARRMVRTAERTGRLYMVSQSRRWDPRHEAARRTIAAGGIGAVTAVNGDFYIGAHFGGFRDEMSSPLILDMAIHHFDLARYITGLDAEWVFAHEFNPRGSWYRGAAAASCIFGMSNAVVFTYRGSWCAEGRHTSWNGDWRFVGERGTLICAQDQPPTGEVVAGDTGFNRPLAPLAAAEPENTYFGMHGALREMLAFLREGARPQTECHDNIKSLAMVFAALASSRQQARVSVAT